MDITLSGKQPFSLPAVLRSHGWIQLAPFVAQDPYHEFGYVLQLKNGRLLSLHGQPVENGLLVIVSEQLNADETAELRATLNWMLGLDRDLSPFYAVAGQEPKLSHVVDRAAGRILRSATVFEDVVKTILTTNTAWSGTKRMVGTLVDLYGRPLPGETQQRAFPTPADLAAVDGETLRQEAKLGYRAPYIAELAQRVNSGDLDLEAFKTAGISTAELRKQLLAIKGIGSYAAANLLMLLGRTDYIPIDSYALKVVSEEFHNGRPVKPADVDAAFERFAEWKGMAFWFWNYGGEE